MSSAALVAGGAPPSPAAGSPVTVPNQQVGTDIGIVVEAAPGATPCDGISNAVDIRCTMDHELVADWGLAIITSASIPGGIPTLAGQGVPPGAGQASSSRGGNGLVHLHTTTWPRCASMVGYSRRPKLTEGEADDSGPRGGAVLQTVT